MSPPLRFLSREEARSLCSKRRRCHSQLFTRYTVRELRSLRESFAESQQAE